MKAFREVKGFSPLPFGRADIHFNPRSSGVDKTIISYYDLTQIRTAEQDQKKALLAAQFALFCRFREVPAAGRCWEVLGNADEVLGSGRYGPFDLALFSQRSGLLQQTQLCLKNRRRSDEKDFSRTFSSFGSEISYSHTSPDLFFC